MLICLWDHVACQNQDHRDHSGIGGTTNKYFFLIVFQRLMDRKSMYLCVVASNRPFLYHIPLKKPQYTINMSEMDKKLSTALRQLALTLRDARTRK